MAAELVFTRDADADISGAYAWYEDQRPGLGEEFLRSVNVCIQDLLRNPAMYPAVRGGYRRALTQRFPYAIFYEHTGNSVLVRGVLHTARDPRKWQQRLP